MVDDVITFRIEKVISVFKFQDIFAIKENRVTNIAVVHQKGKIKKKMERSLKESTS